MSNSSDDRFHTVEQFRDTLWQVSTIPPEAQQLPQFLGTAPYGGQTEPKAPAGIQQVAEPGTWTWAGET
jgi:hypothetical protein